MLSAPFKCYSRSKNQSKQLPAKTERCNLYKPPKPQAKRHHSAAKSFPVHLSVCASKTTSAYLHDLTRKFPSETTTTTICPQHPTLLRGLPLAGVPRSQASVPSACLCILRIPAPILAESASQRGRLLLLSLRARSQERRSGASSLPERLRQRNPCPGEPTCTAPDTARPPIRVGSPTAPCKRSRREIAARAPRTPSKPTLPAPKPLRPLSLSAQRASATPLTFCSRPSRTALAGARLGRGCPRQGPPYALHRGDRGALLSHLSPVVIANAEPARNGVARSPAQEQL